MVCKHKNASPVGEFLELYSKLDEIDKIKVAERIKTLLENDKYSVKRRIIDRTDGIITVNFK